MLYRVYIVFIYQLLHVSISLSQIFNILLVHFAEFLADPIQLVHIKSSAFAHGLVFLNQLLQSIPVLVSESYQIVP